METITDPMRVFVAAVELGGFTAAADRLELTPSAVSKIISRLEDRLGVRLLHRTTRRIALTPEGEAYFNGAKFIVSEVDELEAAVGQSGTQAKGLLRVNSGIAFGNYQLMPALPDFMQRNPDMTIAVELTDRRVDILAERTDIAIRTGPIGDTSLIARKFAEMRRVICAAPSYLKRRGRPKSPADLAEHDCLLISDNPSLGRWPFKSGRSTNFIDVKGRITAGSSDALLQLAVAGAGITRMGDMVVGDALRSGALVPLLTDTHVVEPVPVSAVYPPGRHRSPKVRVFVDFLVETFRHEPWRV